ncbi:MAG: hypothetical protein ABI824_19355, partial [Acidobacteriota bacterium]
LPGGSRKRVLIAMLSLFLLWIAVPWFQREASRMIATTGKLEHGWLLEMAVHGNPLHEGMIGGILGPLFLLAPLALLSLRSSAGRHLIAWIAGLTMLLLGVLPMSHIEPRTLIPILPFVALALALAISEWRGALATIGIAAIVMGWPAIIFLYSDDGAWRIPRIHTAEWQAAFRQEPEDHYLLKYLRGYQSGRMLDERVGKGELVLALSPFQTAYHTVRVLDASERSSSAEGRRLRDIVTKTVDAASGDPTTASQARVAAAQAFKQAGVSWVLIDESDPNAHEMFHQAAAFGLTVRWIVEGIEVFKVN